MMNILVSQEETVPTLLTLDFEGGEGLVDNLAGSQGGGLPRWHNLKTQAVGVKSRNPEIWKMEIWKSQFLTWKTQGSSCLPIAFSPMQKRLP